MRSTGKLFVKCDFKVFGFVPELSPFWVRRQFLFHFLYSKIEKKKLVRFLDEINPNTLLYRFASNAIIVLVRVYSGFKGV